MPELPEVEIVRRGLMDGLIGRTIGSVEVHEHRLRWPLPADFGARLQGSRILAIDRRGKYLQLRLDRDRTLLVHLGMTGQLRLFETTDLPPPGAHDHVDIRLADGRCLRYTDIRRFGSMHLYEGADAAQPLLAHLGVEPLSDAFTERHLRERLAHRRAAIKLVLMDATVVAGVGNIYANEALFRAGIRPTTPAHRLGRTRVAKLVAEVRAVLAEAIEAGGTTLRDFVHADGGTGYFQLDTFVYGREGLPCRVCGTTLRALRQANRATVYCPRCQR
ncbi:MAG: bifunctional DNA-formamidopyrimidine glycosylase/DNA-(apurinic or apyrimidinic site) lyase [Casimicrobiaceae bacterium]